MAASVRVEDEAFSDLRYQRLARLAGLADADHARGKLLVLWRQCTVEQTYVLHADDVRAVLGEDGPDALCRARLGGWEDDEYVRIKGAKGRVEWLAKLRENGKKGGRPPKNQKGRRKDSVDKTKRKPSGSADQNPPAPAPAPEGVSRAGAREVTHTVTDKKREVVQAIAQEHCERHAALRRDGVPGGLSLQPMDRRLLEAISARLGDCWEANPDAGYDGAAEQLRHVLAVGEARAKAKRTLEGFGSNLWGERAFGYLRELSAEQAGGRRVAPPPKNVLNKRRAS